MFCFNVLIRFAKDAAKIGIKGIARCKNFKKTKYCHQLLAQAAVATLILMPGMDSS